MAGAPTQKHLSEVLSEGGIHSAVGMIWVMDSIAWVRCASGSVFTTFWSILSLQIRPAMNLRKKKGFRRVQMGEMITYSLIYCTMVLMLAGMFWRSHDHHLIKHKSSPQKLAGHEINKLSKLHSIGGHFLKVSWNHLIKKIIIPPEAWWASRTSWT